MLKTKTSIKLFFTTLILFLFFLLSHKDVIAQFGGGISGGGGASGSWGTSKTCNCGTWYDRGCNYCSSYYMGQIQYCYWSDGSGWCDTNTRCVYRSSCAPPTPTPTKRPPTPTPDTRPDCGHTCLNHGTASVGWPDCSCTNRAPASGYTKIGTWGSSDCSQCTGYRRLAPTATPTPSCTCSNWSTGTCGGGSCSDMERYQTRSCTPSGCDSTSRCNYDSSCCQCTSWVYGACGTDGGCPVGQRRRTRSCSPSGCSTTSECVNDSACAPNCTIGYPPFTVNIGRDKELGVNIYPNQYATGVDRVEFSESSSLIDVAPGSDPTSPYSTMVTGIAEGSASVSVTSYLTPSGSCNESVPVSVLAVGPWFQTQGGHIYADGDISDNIPDTAINRNLSIEQDSYPGIVSYNAEASLDLWDGYPSNDTANHWSASSTYQGKRFNTWSFFTRKYGERLTENFNGTLPGANGVYYSDSDKNLSGNWDLSSLPIGTWIVIMVEGDINIPVEITVPEGSFLALVAQNDIIFDGAVTQAQGMFVADNAINTGTSDQRFDGYGIFASSSFILDRDYEVFATNQTTPVEYFTFRPDFLISSFKDPDNNLWWFNSLWEELAP